MATQQKMDETSEEIDWITGNLGSYPLPEFKLGTSIKAVTHDDANPDKVITQQSGLLKPVLMDIAQFGLNYAYNKLHKPDDDHEKGTNFQRPKSQKKVIIVGAGMAGLSAGYELSKVAIGHDVEILEMQTRLGG